MAHLEEVINWIGMAAVLVIVFAVLAVVLGLTLGVVATVFGLIAW